jgi:hypothetical protein
MTLAPGHLDTGGNLTSPPPGRVPGSSEPPAGRRTELRGTWLGTLWAAQGAFTGW